MTTAYTNNLRLSEMGTGENAGTWGNTTNTNLELIGEALGYGTENMGSDANTTITMADGTSDGARAFYLKITSTSLSTTRTVTLAPNTVSKVWIIENATTGSQSIIISQGSGASVTIPNGKVKVVITDGGGSGAIVYDVLEDVVFANDVVCSGTFQPEGDTSAGDAAAVGFAAADGIIVTGQGSTNDVTIKNDADGTVIAIPTGTVNATLSGDLTIGTGTEVDRKIVFDGHAQDFYMGLDDSADDLVIGLGATVGTTPAVSIDENQAVVFPAAAVTIGDGTAEDTKLVFDGNAQDFYVGVDDSADDLVFGQGSTVGTNVAFSIDENQLTNFSHAAIGSTQTADATGSTVLDFQTYQNFLLTFTGNVTLANPSTEAVGQSGFIIIIQDGTGSRTLALGTDYETAGGAGLTISTAASAVDVVPYVVKASGSIQLGAAQLAFS
tara:strand:- start:688 stop:2007 length:1320 start_codon:yes stop_codon:yes gene_type:complete